MQDFIQKLNQKPEHVRRRIAVGASAGVTGFVGIIWATAMATSGAFALNTERPAEPRTAGEASANAFALSGTNVKSNFSQLVGAVGAATGATTSDSALIIVDGDTTSTFDAPSGGANPSATVIPF